MAPPDRWRRIRPILQSTALVAALAGVVVLLMLWLMGALTPKVRPGNIGTSAAAPPVSNLALVQVRMIRIPRVESAVGTVRPVHETAVASNILAQVAQVDITAGQRVEAGALLVRLEDGDLKARLHQAEAAADAARAARDQARIEFDRITRMIASQAATPLELDRANATLKSAEAQLQRAEQMIQEARTILGYTTIRAPLTGIVVDKKISAGDTVAPGQILLTLYDPTKMQLVASVRESLTHRLKTGQTIQVHLDALDESCAAQVSEIVPEAQTASRTFLVKVAGPCPPGIYAGMFGRLIIPLEEEEVLVIPQAAVRRIGQLDMVEVSDAGALRRRAVQLGRTIGDQREVLAGLKAGEQVALADAATRPQEADHVQP